MRKHKTILLVILLLFLIFSGGHTRSIQAQEAGGTKTRTGKAVHIEKIPSSWALVREVQGGYEKHTEVFQEMMRYVGENFRAVGFCFGIYPTDPDAVKQGTQRWKVGVRVTTGKPLGYGNSVSMRILTAHSTGQLQRQRKQLKAAQAPYRLELIEPTETAILESSVGEAPKDGLSMFAWMAENGYVQIAPTRMEYMSHDGPPNKIPTRIVVPVKKRPSGLAIPGN
jgi:hypothetical protein